MVNEFKASDRKKHCWLYVLVNIHDDFALHGLSLRVLLTYINGIKANTSSVKEKSCVTEQWNETAWFLKKEDLEPHSTLFHFLQHNLLRSAMNELLNLCVKHKGQEVMPGDECWALFLPFFLIHMQGWVATMLDTREKWSLRVSLVNYVHKASVNSRPPGH